MHSHMVLCVNTNSILFVFKVKFDISKFQYVNFVKTVAGHF